jgi:hypothetical protein
MNMFMPLIVLSALAIASSAPLQPEPHAVKAPDLIYIPALSMGYNDQEILIKEIGSDGELGDTCWTHSNGEVAMSGITNIDGSVVYDDAPDYSRCASMD